VIDDPQDSRQLSDEVTPAHHAVVPPAEPPRDEAAPEQTPPAGPQPPAAESPQEEFVAEEAPAEESAAEEVAAEEAAATDEGPADELVEEEEVEEEVEPRGPIEETPVADEPPLMNWYILKVQSNREESIRESLQRRVKVAGLERYFGEVIVPTEMVSEFKGGKKRVVKRKLYPGYLVAHMEINDETWFLVRETPGIGDFTGSAGKPTPMQQHEVNKIVAKQEEKADEAPKLKINFNVGDRVKINEGTFENFEGEVDSIDEASGRVTVMINIFGRSTPVELEYWQIEAI
jgi:transcription termination/antitermination protein NusG